MRNSSFEGLRIVLIFMVMINHINMWFIGMPNGFGLERAIRCLIAEITIPSVNAFVLISGWFGIRNGYSKIMPICAQMLVCTVPIAACFAISGQINLLSLDGVYTYLLGGNQYWFVFDYLALLMFAPLLNNAVERLEEKDMRKFLIWSYAFVFAFDFIFHSTVVGYDGGYSLLWFVYLYILARYMRLHGVKVVDRHKWTLLIGSILAQSVLLYFHLTSNRYTNPLLVVEAMCLVLIAKDYVFESKVVNVLASGALMAYMLHMQPCLTGDIRELLSALYKGYGYFTYIVASFAMLVALYAVSVALSQLVNKVLRK